jgi:hypothetical protein
MIELNYKSMTTETPIILKAQKHGPTKLARDIGAIITSVAVAYVLIEINAFDGILHASSGMKFLGSFIAGIFFTSVFTFALSTVALAEIALTNNILGVAFFGGLGAVVGDLIIFRFLRKGIAEDIEELIKKEGKRLDYVFHLRFFRFLIPFIGALIIASPFPDELGLAMMGIVKLEPKFLVPISFVLNSLGILILLLIAQGLFG